MRWIRAEALFRTDHVVVNRLSVAGGARVFPDIVVNQTDPEQQNTGSNVGYRLDQLATVVDIDENQFEYKQCRVNESCNSERLTVQQQAGGKIEQCHCYCGAGILQ